MYLAGRDAIRYTYVLTSFARCADRRAAPSLLRNSGLFMSLARTLARTLAQSAAPLLAVLLLFFGSTACQNKAAKLLEGTWGIDHEEMIQSAINEDMSPKEQELARMLAQTLQLNLRLSKDKTYELYVSATDAVDVSTGNVKIERIDARHARLSMQTNQGDTRFALVQLEDEDRLTLQFAEDADASFKAAQALPVRRLTDEEFDARTQFILQQQDAEAENTPASAAPNTEQKLHGAWLLMNDATLAQLPKQQQESAAAWIQNTKLGIVFGPDGSLEMHLAILGDTEYSEGSYTILEKEADRIALTMRTDNDADHDIMIAAFLDEERMLLTPAATKNADPNSRPEPLILRRVTKREMYRNLNENKDLPTLKSLGLD